jgi:hypothetical protein
VIAASQEPLTVHGALGLPYGAAALAWGAIFLALVLVIDRVSSEKRYAPAREHRTLVDWIRGEWSWTASGAIAGALVVIATADGGYLGFSGAILAAVGGIAHLAGHPLEVVPRVTDDILWRAALIAGVFPGAWLAHRFSLPLKAAAEEGVPPKVLDGRAIARSFSAAAVMTLGALVGGGCTTGAFISAWPTLSVGSLAMAGTFFVVSMLVSNTRLLVLHSYDLGKAQAVGERVYD